jgi:hypothetical protein
MRYYKRRQIGGSTCSFQLSDDRNPEERAKGGKTRFGTIDCFIHPTSAQFNDIPVPYEERVMARLLAEGVDPTMAQHIAHLFIWDPLLVSLSKFLS